MTTVNPLEYTTLCVPGLPGVLIKHEVFVPYTHFCGVVLATDLQRKDI